MIGHDLQPPATLDLAAASSKQTKRTGKQCKECLETTSEGIHTNTKNEVEMTQEFRLIERRKRDLDTPKQQRERSMANWFG